MSQLVVTSLSTGNAGLLDDQVYCKWCLEEQKSLLNGHLSKIYCAKTSTATGNHLSHAATKHKKQTSTAPAQLSSKLSSWLTKSCGTQPAVNAYEFNRDLGLLVCKDLAPFDLVEKPGFKAFCKKNLPTFDLPAANSIGGAVLNDVYTAVKQKVLALL